MFGPLLFNEREIVERKGTAFLELRVRDRNKADEETLTFSNPLQESFSVSE